LETPAGSAKRGSNFEHLQHRAMNSASGEPIAFMPEPPTRMRLRIPGLRSEWLANWPRGRSAVLLFLVWTAVGVFQAVPEALVNPSRPALISKVVDNWAWALMTPAIMLIDRRLASRQISAGQLVVLFLLLSVPFSLTHTYLCGVLLYPFPEVWWSPLRNKDFAVYFFLGGWATYCAVIGVLQALRYHDRYLAGQLQLERVEKSLIESRLNALRLQLEPHFLFNTLNAISSEAAANPGLAREMIGDLGALLRQSLDCQDQAEISLAQELALLEHYISIQRVRFGDRIDIRVNVEPQMLSAMVPSMLLQPLVENAIRHGIEGRESGGTVLISASKRWDELQIEVQDDGVGLPPDWRMESCTGHGLRMTRERLSTLYAALGGKCLTMRRRDGGGTQVTILIPLRGPGRGRHAVAG
jgi:signal transduction histidine kinase